MLLSPSASATPEKVILHGQEGVWFPTAEAEMCLHAIEAKPHTDAIQQLAADLKMTCKALTRTASQTFSLSDILLTQCKEDLSQCRADASSILHSPFLQVTAGAFLGVAACHAAALR